MSESEHYTNGHAAGTSAAGWVDVADRRVAENLIDGYNDGDPEVMDAYAPRSPLSGEWGGESMPELLGEDYTDDDAEDYERGYDAGYWHELMRRAFYIAGAS